jgi:hypothetical protein
MFILPLNIDSEEAQLFIVNQIAQQSELSLPGCPEAHLIAPRYLIFSGFKTEGTSHPTPEFGAKI